MRQGLAARVTQLGITLCASLFCCLAFAVAEEGMWLPEQQPPWVQPPQSAVVKVGGCSGTFVSPHGLVLTNHHCILEVLQYRSTVAQNYFQDGFLALRPDLELVAPRDFTVSMTLSRQDVSEQVLQGVSSRLTGQARFNQIASNRNDVLRRCEQQANRQCRVADYYGGQGYLLVTDRVFSEVRLVWAPPVQVGHFGGVDDNWQWPRHSADFALVRVYDADGKPFQPEHWLPLSPAAPMLDEAVFVAGFPGLTQRHRPVAEAELALQHFYPQAQQYLSDFLAITQQQTDTDAELHLRYAPSKVRWGNRYQNYAGMQTTADAEDLLSLLAMEQESLRLWLAEEEREAQYQQSVELIKRATTTRAEQLERQIWWSFFQELRLPMLAQQLYRLAQENSRSDDRRTRGYQAQQIPALRAQFLSMQRQFDAQVEVDLLTYLLERHQQLPERQQISFIRDFFQLQEQSSRAEIRAFVAALYQQTELADADNLPTFMNMNVNDLRRHPDPWLQFAVTTAQARLDWDLTERELRGFEQQGNALWYAAWRQFKRAQESRLADNANRTYRLSRGFVRGDNGEPSHTTLSSLLALAGTEARYELPFAMHAAVAVHGAGCFAASTEDLTVNFLSTADGTGGSSGSPTTNINGELIGLVFDSTTPAILSDWHFSADRHRLIHSDVRYLLWLLRYVYQAQELLTELGFVENETGCYLHQEPIIPSQAPTDAAHPDPEA